MYGSFIQFTIPKIGQALIGLALYGNFLKLPFVSIFYGTHPLLYFAIPLLLLGLLSYISRDPLGPGMIFVSHLTVFYIIGDVLAIPVGLLGGTAAYQIWEMLSLDSLLPWLLTVLVMLWGRARAKKLCVTRYQLQTAKPLPGGKLRIVQISDVHPGATMNHTRIPELRQKIEALAPDLIVLTGDIYDEYTVREEFDAFNALYAALKAPLGKWYIYGNHDLGQYFRESAFTRADLETAFAAGDVHILEDACAFTQGVVPVRLVGRKDWLFTEQKRFSAAELMPNGSDGTYTIWLDHEPREFKEAAAAGADVIFSGHTHGGQIWPAGLIARLFRYNEINYGAKLIAPGCTAIVSGGTGTWGYSIRTEAHTEIVCVDVTSEQAAT